MWRLGVLLWGSAMAGRGGNDSRFGNFLFPVTRYEFPIGAATGIRWQRVDFNCRFQCQNGTYRAKSKKFPVPRE
jgi:hypothetical protein